jgi:CubicO group peptidase (beta-lactamase class C family)
MDSAVLSRGLRDLAGETRHLHSLLIARKGCLVVEAYWPPYTRETRHYLNSATKVVLSALVGIAVHEGRLREDASVLAKVPADAKATDDPRRRAITIDDLLTMASGIAWHQSAPDNTSDQMGRSADWVRFILERPMAADPGRITNYSNGDSHLLSAVLQAAVGETALDFARTRLFTPLGIEDVRWDQDPQGRSIGSAALQMRPVDLMKIGFLYSGGGRFGSRGILEGGWIERSLSTHGSMPTKGGPVPYGYYWWLYPERHVAEAWGGAGQRLGVIRDLQVVVVMTADDPDDYPRSPLAGHLYDLIRGSVKSPRALRPNPAAASELEQVITDLIARQAAHRRPSLTEGVPPTPGAGG